MKRNRDNFKAKVWKIQKEFFDSDNPRSLGELQKLAHVICDSEWFRRRWAYDNILIKDGRGRRSATSRRVDNDIVVTLPKHTRTDSCLLLVLPYSLIPDFASYHGAEYCRIWVDLMAEFQSRAIADYLTTRLLEEKIPLAPAPLPPQIFRLEDYLESLFAPYP